MNKGRFHHFTPESYQQSAQLEKLIQRGQNHKSHQSMIYRPYFGMGMEFGLSTILKEVSQSMATIRWRNWCVWIGKSRKTGLLWRRKTCFVTKIMHRLPDQWKRCKNTWNMFPIASIFTRFGSQLLFFLRKSQKMLEICIGWCNGRQNGYLLWRNYITLKGSYANKVKICPKVVISPYELFRRYVISPKLYHLM